MAKNKHTKIQECPEDLPTLDEVVRSIEGQNRDITKRQNNPNNDYCPIKKENTGDGVIRVLGPGRVVCQYYVSHGNYSECELTSGILRDKRTSFCAYSGLPSWEAYNP